jgi:hypothetical protein
LPKFKAKAAMPDGRKHFHFAQILPILTVVAMKEVVIGPEGRSASNVVL